MAASHPTDSVQGGLSDEEKRDNVIRLAFGGNPERLREFCRAVEEVIPPGTTVVLRGSSLTGWRWDHTQPFDGEGPGTSDLDLTLVGDGPLAFFKANGFFVPGVHSRPLSDDDPDIAPDLVPLRQRLMAMVHRPVNIQASREIVIQVRGDLIGQPYLELFRKPEGLSLNGPSATCSTTKSFCKGTSKPIGTIGAAPHHRWKESLKTMSSPPAARGSSR